MASNKLVRFGPVSLGTGAANVVNPPIITGGTGIASATANCYLIIRHIRLVNRTAGAATASLFIGATGAAASGTEFLGNGISIPANSFVEWFGLLRLEPADFLTGLASASSTITFEGEGEIGVV